MRMMMAAEAAVSDDLTFLSMRKVAKVLGRRDLRSARNILVRHDIPIIRLNERSDGITLSALRELLAKCQAQEAGGA